MKSKPGQSGDARRRRCGWRWSDRLCRECGHWSGRTGHRRDTAGTVARCRQNALGSALSNRPSPRDRNGRSRPPLGVRGIWHEPRGRAPGLRVLPQPRRNWSVSSAAWRLAIDLRKVPYLRSSIRPGTGAALRLCSRICSRGARGPRRRQFAIRHALLGLRLLMVDPTLSGAARSVTVDKRQPCALAFLVTSLRVLTWCCGILLAVLSLLPERQMVRTGLPGQLEHFVAYAGSAAIAMAGYGASRGSMQIIGGFWCTPASWNTSSTSPRSAPLDG